MFKDRFGIRAAVCVCRVQRSLVSVQKSPNISKMLPLGLLIPVFVKTLHFFTPSSPCAVERRFPVAGANPAQHLSLRLVAALAYDGGNDMI